MTSKNWLLFVMFRFMAVYGSAQKKFYWKKKKCSCNVRWFSCRLIYVLCFSIVLHDFWQVRQRLSFSARAAIQWFGTMLYRSLVMNLAVAHHTLLVLKIPFACLHCRYDLISDIIAFVARKKRFSFDFHSSLVFFCHFIFRAAILWIRNKIVWLLIVHTRRH